MAQIRAPLLGLLMLCALALLSRQADAQRRGCCTKYVDPRISPKSVVGFFIQEVGPKCRINAIIIRTKKGGKYCMDPELQFVKDLITNLKGKAFTLKSQKHAS